MSSSNASAKLFAMGCKFASGYFYLASIKLPANIGFSLNLLRRISDIYNVVYTLENRCFITLEISIN
jgi:hypothetical protein